MNRYDVLAWLFPNKCLICTSYVPANTPVCPRCLTAITGPRERNFNIKMGKKSRMFRVYAAHPYTENYRYVMDRLKFNGKTSYAEKLAIFTKDICPKNLFTGATLITFIPMQMKKQKQRGYNQAELFAAKMAKGYGIECRDVLEKTRNNRIQHSLNAEERKQNVKGIFRVKWDIMGQNIILIDDIITTGATMCECAKILFQAGAASVIGLCAADTPSRQETDRI